MPNEAGSVPANAGHPMLKTGSATRSSRPRVGPSSARGHRALVHIEIVGIDEWFRCAERTPRCLLNSEFLIAMTVMFY